MSMNVNNNQTVQMHETAGAGAVLGLGAAAAKKGFVKAKAVAMDTKDTFVAAYKQSGEKQKGIFDKFAEFASKHEGATVKDYIEAQKLRLDAVRTADRIVTTVNQKVAKGQTAEQIGQYKGFADSIIEIGTKAKEQEIENIGKLLDKGKTSTVKDIKEGAKAVGEKVATKAKGIGGKVLEQAQTVKNKVVDFAKMEGKTEYIKAHKDEILGTAKKYAKPAAIGAAVLVGIRLITKAFQGKNKEA